MYKRQLVSSVGEIVDEKLQLSGKQNGTATPTAPTPPTTTVAYKEAQSAAKGSGGGSEATAGTQIPTFSASAKLSPQKVKVLGISR